LALNQFKGSEPVPEVTPDPKIPQLGEQITVED